MLFDIIGYIKNGDFARLFVEIAAMLFVVFCTLPVHEFAHALMATKLGDETPRLSGRLTLRPTAHIDPIGALMIFLVGFGYAKPVPVNIRNLKHGRVGFALVAAAGPVSNLLMAFVFTSLNYTVSAIGALPEAASAVLSIFFGFAASINISLAVFNLLPIPPLDGSRILTLIIPQKYYYQIMRYERYIMIAVFVLIWAGVLTYPLSWLSSVVSSGINYIAGVPFYLAGLI